MLASLCLWGTANVALAVCPAVTRTWTGAGADAKWSTAANWTTGAPSCSGDMLVFPATGSAQLTNTNDVAGRIVGSISVTGDGYTFGGSALVVGGGITSTAPMVGPTFNLPLTMSGVTSTITSNGAKVVLGAGGGITLGGALTFGGTGDTVVGGLVTGTTPWTKTGTGRLYLAGANVGYTATGVTISGGQVRVDDDSGLGAASVVVTVNGTGTLENDSVDIANPIVLDTTTQPALDHFGAGGGSFAGPITLSSDAIIQNSSATNIVYNGVVSGTAMLHAMGGSFTFIAANTYTGGTRVSTFMQIGNGAALGTGPITVDVGSSLALEASFTLTNPIALAGNDSESGGALATDYDVTLSGAVTLSAGATVYVGDGVTLALSGAIGGTGGLVKNGAGVLALSNAGNAWSGELEVSAGTVSNGAANESIPDGVVVGVDAAGTLIIQSSETLGALTGSGIVTLADGATLTSGGANTDETFGGVATGAGALSFVGTANETLSGNSTLQGGTTVTSSTLGVHGGTLGDVLVTSGSTLSLGSQASVGALTITGSTLSPGDVTANRTSTATAVALDASSTLHVTIDDVSANDFSQLHVTGSVSLAGTLDVVGAGSLALGAQVVIVDNQGSTAVAGTFEGLGEGAVLAAGGHGYRISYVGGDGNDVALTIVTPPASGADMGVADMTTGDDLASSPHHGGGCDVGGSGSGASVALCLLALAVATSRARRSRA